MTFSFTETDSFFSTFQHGAIRAEFSPDRINRDQLIFLLRSSHFLLSHAHGPKGPELLAKEPMPESLREILPPNTLDRLVLFYTTLISPGESRNFGLFELPVYDNPQLLSLAHSFKGKTYKKIDPRTRGEDHYILIIIYPRLLRGWVGDREYLEDVIHTFFVKYFQKNMTLDEWTDTDLLLLKEQVILTIEHD
ncbi:MAG: hypothetical protein ACFFCQ_05230 [Promethearchaeota archaeon]